MVLQKGNRHEIISSKCQYGPIYLVGLSNILISLATVFVPFSLIIGNSTFNPFLGTFYAQ